MKIFNRIALTAALLLPIGASAAETAVAAPHVSPDSYKVFVDLPTGYMFVKTPVGWKFRGQLPADRYAQLPVGTYVSLVPSAQVSVQDVAANGLFGNAIVSSR